MKIFSKAWTALLLPMMCTLTGWRQRGHLTRSLYVAYLRGSSAKRYRPNPEAVEADLWICTLRINKYLQLERFVRERFPDSKWAQRLATICEQAQKLHEYVRLHLIEKEEIPRMRRKCILSTRLIPVGSAGGRPRQRGGTGSSISQNNRMLILQKGDCPPNRTKSPPSPSRSSA